MVSIKKYSNNKTPKQNTTHHITTRLLVQSALKVSGVRIVFGNPLIGIACLNPLVGKAEYMKSQTMRPSF